jgi:hypothetical protein
MVGAYFLAKVAAVLLNEGADAAADIEQGFLAAQQAAGAQPLGDYFFPITDKNIADFIFIGGR